MSSLIMQTTLRTPHINQLLHRLIHYNWLLPVNTDIPNQHLSLSLFLPPFFSSFSPSLLPFLSPFLQGISYDHVEVNFFLNGKSLDCPILGVRGTVYPVFYGNNQNTFTTTQHNMLITYTVLQTYNQLLREGIFFFASFAVQGFLL